MKKFRAHIALRLTYLAILVMPDEFLPSLIRSLNAAFMRDEPGFTPPSGLESNARTQKRKARRKRQRDRHRAMANAQKVEDRFDPSELPQVSS